MSRVPLYKRRGAFRFEPEGLSWWDRIRFALTRKQVSLDYGYSRCDVTVAVEFKVFEGKIYILREYR